MHTLGFADTISDGVTLSTPRTYQHPICAKVDETYTANLLRVESLTFVPGFAFLMAEDETRPFKGPPDSVDVSSPELRIAFAELLREKTGEAERVCADRIIIHVAYHALLETMLIQAWTAFEVMTEKLWNGFLDVGLTSITRPTKKETNDNQIGFGSRTKIRNAYRFVFNRDNTTLVGVLADNSLDALAAVRNVYVHSAGIIDDDFMKHSNGVPILSPFRALGENHPIKLTGQIVRALVDPLSQRGYALLRALDDWVKLHP